MCSESFQSDLIAWPSGVQRRDGAAQMDHNMRPLCAYEKWSLELMQLNAAPMASSNRIRIE